MSYFAIEGGRPLCGVLPVGGAKNSVLPILAASLLFEGESVLHNCPDLSDVAYAAQILEQLGCRVCRAESDIVVDSRGMSRFAIDDRLMRKMRSSVIFLGAILARCGQASLSMPGGCELGPRPIDLHLSAMRALGIEVENEGGKLVCRAKNPKGADIRLPFPSVGATENIMLAAVTCPGTTRIFGPAREPEIVDLQAFMNRCGLSVLGAGSDLIEIVGGKADRSPEHTIIPDRIAAATFLSAAAAAGGDVTLLKAQPEHMAPVLAALSRAGCEITKGENFVRLKAPKRLLPAGRVVTAPHPGFPTDAQAPLMAAMAAAAGETVFEEQIFQSRYNHVKGLLRMGADIRIDGRRATVRGVTKLHGAQAEAPDLRGGAALVIAALSAEGESRITGLAHIDRGYERLEQQISRLGGTMARKEEPDECTEKRCG